MNSQLPSTAARRWLVIAAVAFGAAVAVYLLAVCTETGQRLENAALRGADEASSRDAAQASHALNQITVYSLGVAVVLVALIGLLRRRIDLAVAAVGVIVGGQLVVQALKRYLLPRPELVDVTAGYAHNSLPSGHTTIAMTVLFATVIVVPYRWRGVAMLVVLTWAVGIGHYTLTAKWHRLSDTLAADAIALALACLVSWWLARRGALGRDEGRPRILPIVLATLMSVMALVTLILGGILWGIPLTQKGLDTATGDYAWEIYLGATAFASAGSIIAALIFLASWRRIDSTGRIADAVPGTARPDGRPE